MGCCRSRGVARGGSGLICVSAGGSGLVGPRSVLWIVAIEGGLERGRFPLSGFGFRVRLGCPGGFSLGWLGFRAAVGMVGGPVLVVGLRLPGCGCRSGRSAAGARWRRGLAWGRFRGELSCQAVLERPVVMVFVTNAWAGSASSLCSSKNVSAALTPCQPLGNTSSGRPGSEYGSLRQLVSAST